MRDVLKLVKSLLDLINYHILPYPDLLFDLIALNLSIILVGGGICG